MPGPYSLLSLLKQHRAAHPLSYRMLGATVLLGSVVTVVSTAALVVLAYGAELTRLSRDIERIERSIAPTLTESVWSMDRLQVELVLDGLMRSPDLLRAEVELESGERIAREQPRGAALPPRTLELRHPDRPDQPIALLVLTAGDGALMERLRQQAVGIALSQLINVLFVSALVFLLFQRRVTRRLRQMVHFARHLRMDRLDGTLELHRTGTATADEVDEVAHALNVMRIGLLDERSQLQAAEARLQSQHDALESTVARRTAELSRRSRQLERRGKDLRRARDQAEATLGALREAQTQLVEAEKMAALGQLVAGVAHEINTPIGVAVTAASHLRQEAQQVAGSTERGELGRRRLNDFLRICAESTTMIESNLQRAARLIQNFKQVSVDRSAGHIREFELAALLQEIVSSMQSLWRRRPLTVTVECPADLQMTSNPGPFGQVIMNLLNNALVHAFDEDDTGLIRIVAKALPEDRVEVAVIDSGRGMDAAHLGRIFEPFFTTRRGRGGTGLGMHIVFNIVTQALGGRIQVASQVGEGTRVVLQLPISVPR